MGLACKIAQVAAVSLVIAGVALGLYFAFNTHFKQIEELRHGAIVTNSEECAEIGKKIMEKGGSVVDTAIAVLLCEGVVSPQSSGLGGGLIAIVFSKARKHKLRTIISRERAPLAANETMFAHRQQTLTGAIASAVPGELKAFQALHRSHGKLKWMELFKPTISLCYNGIKVSKFLRMSLERHKQIIEKEPTMDIFVNPDTNKIWKEGDVMYRIQLGNTLNIIANEGADVFYKGFLGEKFVEDVKELGGIITFNDMKEYVAEQRGSPDAILLNKYKYHSTDFPTSGALNVFILNMMDELFSKNESVTYHRLVECFKHAFGQRTLMGDRFYEPAAHGVYANLTSKKFSLEILKLIDDERTFNEFKYYGANYSWVNDHGTTSISVLHPNGDGLTITSTINTYFGAKVRSKQTGIILNDSMDDFSTPGFPNQYGLPASPNNYIKPGKRPISSISPSIILDDSENIHLLIGGAGGPRIITSLCQIILSYIYNDETLEDAIAKPRLHHQLFPNQVFYEQYFNDSVLEDLQSIGHSLISDVGKNGFVAVTAIGVRKFYPIAHFDPRRVGGIAYIKKKDILHHK